MNARSSSQRGRRYTIPGMIAAVVMFGLGASIIHDPGAAGRYLLAGWTLSLVGFWRISVFILNE